jgi:hypothetical protein
LGGLNSMDKNTVDVSEEGKLRSRLENAKENTWNRRQSKKKLETGLT